MGTIQYSDIDQPIWQSLLTRLRFFDDTYNCQDDADRSNCIDPRVGELLNKAAGQEQPDMSLLHEAEQRLMRILPVHVLDEDAHRKFGLGEQFGIEGVTKQKTRYEEAETEDAKRAIQFEITDNLQFYFVERLVWRDALLRANERLNRFAWRFIIPSFLIVAFLYLLPGYIEQFRKMLDEENGELVGRVLRCGVTGNSTQALEDCYARFHLMAVMWFGVIGAYFSRLIYFRQNSANMSRQALTTEFSREAFTMRLVLGLMGALVMYRLLKSEIVSGQFFPDLDARQFQFVDHGEVADASEKILEAPVSTSGPSAGTDRLIEEDTFSSDAPEDGTDPTDGAGGTDLPAPDDGDTEPLLPGQKVLVTEPPATDRAPIKKPNLPARMISADFAQLLVWSLLAGFSERLVPARFRTIEDKALGDS